MNLYLFPEAACLNNGYSIAVYDAYLRLKPSKEDMIVWYTIQNKEKMLFLKDGDYIIKKNSFISIKSILNIICIKERTEIRTSELEFLKKYNFDHIHCDDVVMYRAIRKLFPEKKIHVRFHNCFARILDRKKILNLKLDFLFEFKLRLMHKLEKEIFNDKNVYKIFITKEDLTYYRLMLGKYSDSELWEFPIIREPTNKQHKLAHKLVWFGGVESHKKASVNWFIHNVFFQLKRDLPDIELHLWGKGTEKFNIPPKHIYGHGIYHGNDLPLNNALYINPDIIGGGIKLKLLTFLKYNIPFITSIYGFEGYPNEIIDNQSCIVIEDNQWITAIKDRLLNE